MHDLKCEVIPVVMLSEVLRVLTRIHQPVLTVMVSQGAHFECRVMLCVWTLRSHVVILWGAVVTR